MDRHSLLLMAALNVEVSRARFFAVFLYLRIAFLIFGHRNGFATHRIHKEVAMKAS
jgi:hypothetical protein